MLACDFQPIFLDLISKLTFYQVSYPNTWGPNNTILTKLNFKKSMTHESKTKDVREICYYTYPSLPMMTRIRYHSFGR